MTNTRIIIMRCFRRMREAGESHEMCARWICEELEKANLLFAPADVAAREAAAWCAGRDAAARVAFNETGRFSGTRDAGTAIQEAARDETAQTIAAIIRSLTPPTSDALSAALAQARREGMLAAAEVVDSVEVPATVGLAAAIRKLAEGGS